MEKFSWADNVRNEEVLHSQEGQECHVCMYEGSNFNSGNYLFTTDTK